METKVKLGRGKKLCPECESINAARSYKCKVCKYQFKIKKTKRKNEVKQWKDLEHGDIIKVVSGTGPYFLAKENDLGKNIEKGDRVYTGHRGAFEIIKVVADGLVCFGLSKDNRGFCFLYMGKKRYNEKFGEWQEAYQIITSKATIRRGIKMV